MLSKESSVRQSGQSLMELVVVVAVAVIVVGALTFATIASLRNAQFAKHQAQATKLAQEGIERVRTGRDRNRSINSSGGLDSVISWNGDANVGSIWDYQINGNCGDITLKPPVYCYFNITDEGILNYLVASSAFPQGAAEPIPPDPAALVFHRVIILSDESSTFGTQKTVTAIVKWRDFAGEHESRLTTILRKI